MDLQPSNKTLATFGGAIGGGSLVVWIAAQFGLDMPAEVGVAIASIIALIVAYFMPATSGKYVRTEPVVPESELVEGTTSDDLDPSDVIESDYDPTTDTDDQPANNDAGQDGEPVAGAQPVEDAIADESLPGTGSEIGDDS